MELGFHSSFTYFFLYIVPKSNIVVLCFLKQLNLLLLSLWKRERKTFSKYPTYYANESELPDQLLALPRHGRSPQTVLWCPGQPQRRLIMALWLLLLPVFAYSTRLMPQRKGNTSSKAQESRNKHLSLYPLLPSSNIVLEPLKQFLKSAFRCWFAGHWGLSDVHQRVQIIKTTCVPFSKGKMGDNDR